MSLSTATVLSHVTGTLDGFGNGLYVGEILDDTPYDPSKMRDKDNKRPPKWMQILAPGFLPRSLGNTAVTASLINRTIHPILPSSAPAQFSITFFAVYPISFAASLALEHLSIALNKAADKCAQKVDFGSRCIRWLNQNLRKIVVVIHTICAVALAILTNPVYGIAYLASLTLSLFNRYVVPLIEKHSKISELAKRILAGIHLPIRCLLNLASCVLQVIQLDFASFTTQSLSFISDIARTIDYVKGIAKYQKYLAAQQKQQLVEAS